MLRLGQMRRNMADLIGKRESLLNECGKVVEKKSGMLGDFAVGQGAPQLGNAERQQIQKGALHAVCLGACHGNFGTCTGVQHVVCLTGDRGADHVDNGKRTDPLCFGMAERRQRVGGLSRLGDQ